jgi:aspartate kinase
MAFMSSIIVSKFGGSSITNPADIEKIKEIIYSSPERKIIVVSAPGKRNPTDTKVTDMLIELAQVEKNKIISKKIIDRYAELSPHADLENLTRLLEERINQQNLPPDARLDSLKAFGEEACARTLAKAINAEYVDPKDFLVLSSDFGNAKVLPESYEKIKKLSDRKGRLVLPGFYGYTKDERIATMSRGGSDLTGAVIAAGLDAELYENFTDVPGIFAADPRLVKNPRKISTLTYYEMRDLAYLGSKLHPESIIPVAKRRIPIQIRSMENYPEPGTLVVGERELDSKRPIVGIAYQPGFCSFDICQLGLNERIGVLKGITEIFEKNKISIEYIPSAIDDISVIVKASQLKGKKVAEIMSELERSVGEDTKIALQENIGCLVIAGAGLRGQTGISASIQNKLAKSGTNIEFISQGSEERCIIYGIREQDGSKAVNALYNAFLK